MADEAPDLAGIYITDDFIDVVLGRDQEALRRKRSVAELRLSSDPKVNQNIFRFKEDRPVSEAFRNAGDWIKARATGGLRSIGIGCYGPFKKISREDRGHPDYGTLDTTSHGRLSNLNIPQLVLNGLGRTQEHGPKITMETDVGLAAIGSVYNRSRSAASRDDTIDDQVIVFVKASLGIGGAFLRASTPWHGRLHPEMGQCNVPRWPDPNEVEPKWRYSGAMNKNSIEGLASVEAIETRYSTKFDDLKKQPDHEAWTREAWYLAQLAWTITCTICPHQIIFGGRIIGVPYLIDKVRTTFEQDIANWPSFPYIADRVTDYIVPSLAKRDGKSYVDRPGIVGALCLAAMEDQPSAVTTLPERR